MRTGTIETKKVKVRKFARRVDKMQGFGSLGGTDQNNGGGDHNDGNIPNRPANTEIRKWRVGMCAALVTISIFFASFAGSYVWLSSKSLPNWKPFSFPIQIWLGIIFILASGITYRIAQNAFSREKNCRAKNYFKTPLILGVMFFAAQILSWNTLANREIRFMDNPYAIFFYVTTILCSLSLIGGIAALGYLMLPLRPANASQREFEKRKNRFRSSGLVLVFYGLCVCRIVCAA
jgi:heme/copper-type cytochrome/quinol oxidase subunit 3